MSKLDMEAIKRRHAERQAKIDNAARKAAEGNRLAELCHGRSQEHDDRGALIAEVERLTTWRPISEAPKDGTEIRCWCPGIGERVLYLRRSKWTLAGGGLDRNDYEPTYWQPLHNEGPTS